MDFKIPSITVSLLWPNTLKESGIRMSAISRRASSSRSLGPFVLLASQICLHLLDHLLVLIPELLFSEAFRDEGAERQVPYEHALGDLLKWTGSSLRCEVGKDLGQQVSSFRVPSAAASHLLGDLDYGSVGLVLVRLEGLDLRGHIREFTSKRNYCAGLRFYELVKLIEAIRGPGRPLNRYFALYAL